MRQADKAAQFAELHAKGSPLLLYNAWDAGSAKAIEAAGARAIATSSWAVAAAQGYRDGEAVPLQLVEQLISRIVATVGVPVSVDFEGGYSEDLNELKSNISRLLDLGVAGINFEDRVVKGAGLYDVVQQTRRISALRQEAERKRVQLFINARTDVFLGRGGENPVDDVLERARAYAEAGASGFFVPGLKNEDQLALICREVDLPVNILVLDGFSSAERFAELGVSRVSYGCLPYVRILGEIRESAAKALS